MQQELRQLPLPGSLYAQIQALQEGEAQDVCFGLFQNSAQDYATALSALITHILAVLPPAPKQTLILGVGLGTLLTAVARLGHHVQAVASEPAYHAAAARRCDEDTLLPPGRWEDLKLGTKGALRRLFFMNPSAHLNLIQLFGRAYQTLTEDGTLLLVDEFAMDRYAAGYDGRPCLEYLSALAERCGLTLCERQDLSSQAAPTLDYYRQAVETHRARLLQTLDLTEETLNQFTRALDDDRRAYAEGRRAYMLLRFRKRSDLRWRVGHMDEADFPAVAELFQRAFNLPMSRKLWDWKYGEGRGQGIIAWAGDRVVAHYGGITRPLRYMGRPELGCQIADVMVDPTERGVLTRKGPFFLTAASQSEVSRGKHLIGYGFPNARAMKMAVRLGLYAQVGEIAKIYWPPSPKPPSLWTRLLMRVRRIKQTEEDRLDAIAEPLWRQMSTDLRAAIVGVRDGSWLRYRYLAHPDYDYHVLLMSARLTAKPYGIVVLREEYGRCELIDLLAPPAHFPRLIEVARSIAGLWGSEGLYCWISAGYAQTLIRCGGERQELDVLIPTSIWTEDPGPDVLRDRWWLMSGDTDFR